MEARMVHVSICGSRILVSILVLGLLIMTSCTSLDNDWTTAKTKNTVEAYQGFLAKHPNSKYTGEAGELIRDLTPVRGRLFALMPMPTGGNLAIKLQGRTPAHLFSLYSLEGQAGDFEVELTSDTQFIGTDKAQDPSKIVNSGDVYEITGKHKVVTKYMEAIVIGAGASGGVQKQPIEVRIIEARIVHHLGVEQDPTKQ
jgi:hypothetical protein